MNDAQPDVRSAPAAPRRAYRLGKRLKSLEDTRETIVRAAVELHGSVGPAGTSFSAVAERAGVPRSTVYRHFPDEAALFGACTSHWLAEHPWPNSQEWAAIEQPRERIRVALSQLYRYFDQNETMIANSFRDIALMPPFVGELMRAQLRAMHSTLLSAFPAPTQAHLEAAIAFALDFRTARALADAGFPVREAAEFVTASVMLLAEDPAPASPQS